MKSGKFLFIAMIFIVSLLCISAVSAADDAVSDVIADNNDETILEGSIDDVDLGDSAIDELGESDKIALDSADDEDTLGVPAPHGFSDLDYDINANNNSLITLNYGYNYIDYGYDTGIHIYHDMTIDGNGNTISGNNRAPIFYVHNANVTFKNIRFINGLRTASYDGGAAIYGGTAINCTFENNCATGGEGNGGAIAYGTAINCTFIQNQGYGGGAMYAGTAIDCTFYNNYASHAGALYMSDATNCVFVANHAQYEGGAMYAGTAKNCVFLSNSASNGNDKYSTLCEDCIFAESAYLTVPNPATVSVGKKLLFTLKTGDEILNNVLTTIKISQNGEEICTYHALSSEGPAIYLEPGTYTATFSVDNANVDPVTVPIIVRPPTFDDLNDAINGNSNSVVTLTYDYKFTDGDSSFTGGIYIDRSVTIDGQGHTIDASNQARIFNVAADNVLIKNINFVNGHSNLGGAVYWGYCSHGNISGCTFVNNYASTWGGAIYWAFRTDNIAYNCTFEGNYAPQGGAVLSREWVGATVENCIAKTSSDTQFNMICIAPTLTVDNVTSTFSGDTIGFKLLSTNSTVPINDANIIVEVYQNDNLIRTFNCLSGEGWIADLPAGSYDVVYKSQYIGSNEVNAPLTITTDSSLIVLNALVNKLYLDNSTIYLTKDYTYDPSSDAGFQEGITLTRNVIIDGKGHTIDGAERARSFIQNDAKYNVTFKNINFKNCYASGNGGALYAPFSTAINCTFTDNEATMYGGAGCIKNVINCIFISNSAKYGGAVDCENAANCSFNNNHADSDGGAINGGSATNCAFTGNSAYYGGAIYHGNAMNCTFENNEATESGGAINGGSATNCIFTHNRANYDDGGAINGGSATNCTFTNNYAEAAGGAINGGSATNCTFNSNTARNNGGAICNGDAINCIFSGNKALAGGVAGVDAGDAMYGGSADSCVFNGDSCLNVEIAQPTLTVGNFISTFKDGTKAVVNLTSSSGMQITDANILISVYTTAGTFVGNYNGLSGGWTIPLNAGSYLVTYLAKDFDISSAQGMIVVNKDKSTISSGAVTAVYNNNKYLTITLKDGFGRAISGVKVTVTLASAKTYTTDKNGQIKINVGTLVPKTYTAKISFSNANYNASSTTAKVVVKKATPKLTAKAKTFKVNVKTKKYTITLKNNKGKVMKKAKLTLKVGKKTYKATTNSKGKATFKITKLTKKGKYTAVIKYAGNKYYNKLNKKAKITVK